MAKNALPKTIYVTLENADTDDEYLNARESPEGFSETTQVAVYELVELGEVKVTREYNVTGSPRNRSLR